MGRKRYVTSDMSSDDQLGKIAETNPVAALMWPWYVTYFDDWGRAKASPGKIKLEVFPGFPYTAEEIDGATNLFAEQGLVYLYEIKGRKYMAIEPDKWFDEFQTYIHKEKKKVDKSNIPAPINPPWERESAELSGDERESAELSGDERINVPSPSSLPPFSFDPSKDDQVDNSACAREQNFNQEQVWRVSPLPPGMTEEQFLADYEESKRVTLMPEEPADKPPWEEEKGASP